MARRVASSRNGEGASSMTFWCRRCIEHSRFPEVDDVAVGVAQHLDLDVPGLLDELLDEHPVVAEGVLGLSPAGRNPSAASLSS